MAQTPLRGFQKAAQRNRLSTKVRRTGATMLGELGDLPDIVETTLNHVSIRSPLAASNNRSRHRPQVRGVHGWRRRR